MCHSKICALGRFIFSIVFLGDRMIEVAMQQNEVHWEGIKLFKDKKNVRVTNLSIQPILYILLPFAVGGLLLKLKFLVGWSKSMIIMVAWPLGGSNGQVFSLSQDLLARNDISFKRRLIISGRRHDFVLKPQRSTLLISYQIFQTSWPSASNTLGTTEFADSLWPSGRKNSLHHSLDELESLFLFCNTLKTQP